MNFISKVKFKIILSFFLLCLKSRKSLAIALLIFSAIYIIFSSLNSWPFLRSVSTRDSDSNSKNIFNEVIHVPLPNLIIQRPLNIDVSHLKTISAENLTNLIANNGFSKTPSKKYTNETSLSFESQTDRKKLLNHFCNKYGLKHRIFSIWRKSSNNYKGRHKYCNTKNCPMLVDVKNNFMLCFIQKVASTSIKKYFSILSGEKLKYSVSSNITAFHLNANDLLFRVSPMFYNTKQLNSEYFKTIFVRHPFLRIISAFKDKGEKSRLEEPYFYAKYWDKIMRDVRGEHNLNNNSRPVFKEFVKLLLSTSPFQYDEHWAPYWTRCEPCFIDYDFIGKLETSDEDFKFMANKNKIPLSQFFWENKSVSKKMSNKEAKKYLLQISAQEIIELYKKYFLDFKLFGYTIEEIFH